MKLAGRIAPVTGAQQGIGAAIAVELAEKVRTSRSPGSMTSRRLKRSQRTSAKSVAVFTSSAPMSRG
jgi:NAD(P)-dependent dehydrogenase (short-subunit alcohol dehydrogenase family)